MAFSKKKQAQEPQLTPAQRIKNDWAVMVNRLSYRAMVNNLPFLAFVSVLCMLYIANSQQAINMQRDLNNQGKALKELRWKYMDIKMSLMNNKMESQVLRNAGAYGLKPLMMPAYKVETDNTNK